MNYKICKKDLRRVKDKMRLAYYNIGRDTFSFYKPIFDDMLEYFKNNLCDECYSKVKTALGRAYYNKNIETYIFHREVFLGIINAFGINLKTFNAF